jgi:hypothetical protein
MLSAVKVVSAVSAHHALRKTVQMLLSIAAGGLFVLAMRTTVHAENQTFVIPVSDGYGISECLAPGAACGKVVADAWCEAHGLDQALAFGSAEDMTASTGAPAPRSVDPGSLIVTCKE